MPKDPCERLMQFFVSEHLINPLKPVVQQCEQLAQYMLDNVPHNAELTVALRHLKVAKDSFCNAVMYKEE